MAARDVFLVLTLAALYWILEKGVESGIPEYAVRKCDSIIGSHIESFKKALKADIKIVMGTDADSPFNNHGNNSFELNLMVKYGMDHMQAIKSATTVSAEMMGISNEVGAISAGKRDDLLVLEDNSLKEINNINKVHAVYQEGRNVE